MTELPAPEPRKRHTGLVVALAVCVVVAVAGCGVTGVLLYRLYGPDRHDPLWPAGWATARFAVSGSDEVRDETGQLLVLLSGTDTRYAVRSYGVELAARPGQRATLDRLTRALPLRAALYLGPVVSATRASGPCTPVNRYGAACDPGTGQAYTLNAALMDGGGIADATVTRVSGQWAVNVTFTASGQRAFTNATGRYVGKQVAIVVAGVALTAPTVNQAISGPMQLAGGFTGNQAREIAAALRLSRHPVTISHA
ncbi:SecDF P1 head subdomain-containing protein [Actinocatenispora rupis]|uniref:SecDF P1 head subdomain domain-containing protein n=1 Tax=Actinocatenispora rupis TaxID=519421 RepID=A0A8J3JAI4_9ACTN|nr:hypothetical protein [Actinocatenispora rupis]GID13092.1 hypothetical protein Aru02nite_39810 [Actinocatenispora rupis]